MKPTRPELPREFVAVHKRRRMIDAMAELCAEQGYEATKIADVVRRAGVARKTLYDNFDGKEELFLAAFDSDLTRRSARSVEAACEAAGEGWQAAGRSRPRGAARLRRRASRPRRGCAWSRRSRRPQPPPPATRRRCSASSSCCASNAPAGTGLPDTIEETLVGGVAWILHQRSAAAKPRRSPTCCPSCRSSCFRRTAV